MRRPMISAALVAVALTVAGFSQSPFSTFPRGTSLRRTQVSAQTIAALPSGKNYVVDLTQRGVVYKFDPQAGQIDFSRVRVRTAQGEVAIGSFLQKRIPREKLSTFRYTSNFFLLGTSATRTVRNPSTPTSLVNCQPDQCDCEGEIECETLLDALKCNDYFCVQDPGRPVFCICFLN